MGLQWEVHHTKDQPPQEQAHQSKERRMWADQPREDLQLAELRQLEALT